MKSVPLTLLALCLKANTALFSTFAFGEEDQKFCAYGYVKTCVNRPLAQRIVNLAELASMLEPLRFEGTNHYIGADHDETLICNSAAFLEACKRRDIHPLNSLMTMPFGQ